jgi:phytoene/squalene synthetase
MLHVFDEASFKCSRVVTLRYSTSFSLSVRLLNSSLRNAIYGIYGFVRFADEIVDTFHDKDKVKLLNDFEAAYYDALAQGISLNPILNAFVITVKKYNIDDELVQAFLTSMKFDIDKKEYDSAGIKEYIYGSADVVGLMCLKVFVNVDETRYNELKPFAMALGSAFQKVNFLRDLNNDVNELDRNYFPLLNSNKLTEETKQQLIDDINEDFKLAREGIRRLPASSKLGVYTAYIYYRKLTRKIQRTHSNTIMSSRIRISNFRKFGLILRCYLVCKFRMV